MPYWHRLKLQSPVPEVLPQLVSLFRGGLLEVLYCFFFSSRRRHTRCSRDWSSDVCSSDLRARTCATIGVPGSRTRGTSGSSISNARRSEERRVGKECRSRWSPDH